MLSGKHKISIDMTVLERQQARIKWLQQQQHDYANNYDSIESCSMPAPFQGFFDHESMNGKMLDWKKQPEMYLGNNDFRKYHGLCIVETEHVANTKMDVGQPAVAMRSLEIDHCLSRTSSCQIGVSEAAKVGEVAAMEVAGEKMALMENKQSKPRRSNSMKRKAESFAIEECKDKMITDAELESKKEKNIAEISADSSKQNQKTSVLPKTDYIHVRARRGQATDSHSLAERARREKISKKMKCLQDLVPGCDKITGRAGMLEEIINYVQSLQRQVEFLSMKLAALNPRPEFNIDNVSGKEFPAHVASFPAAISSTIASLPHLQLYSVQQQEATGSRAKALTSPPSLVLEKISSSSAFNHELCLDSFAQVQPFWDSDSQNLQNLGFH